VTFLAVAFLAIIGCAAAAWLVRKPPEPVAEDDGAAPAAAISPT
jgi:hypothetical protein